MAQFHFRNSRLDLLSAISHSTNINSRRLEMTKILFCIAALSLASPALAQQQTCRLFGGGCRPVAPAPQIIQQAGPSVDLGRLEATTDAIRGEQRYQTHLLYLIYGQMQRSADLALLQAARTPSGVDEHGATRVPLPSEVQPTPIPLPSQVQPTPIPLPNTVTPTQIPLPIQVNPTVIPGPTFTPGQGGGGGQFQQVPPPPTGGGTGIPAPTSKIQHKAWPNVARK